MRTRDGKGPKKWFGILFSCGLSARTFAIWVCSLQFRSHPTNRRHDEFVWNGSLRKSSVKTIIHRIDPSLLPLQHKENSGFSACFDSFDSTFRLQKLQQPGYFDVSFFAAQNFVVVASSFSMFLRATTRCQPRIHPAKRVCFFLSQYILPVKRKARFHVCPLENHWCTYLSQRRYELSKTNGKKINRWKEIFTDWKQNAKKLYTTLERI